jgi:hypothetical protein
MGIFPLYIYCFVSLPLRLIKKSKKKEEKKIDVMEQKEKKRKV